MGLKFKLHDAKLHEDAVHRGPAQVLPAIRNAIYASMMSAGPTLLEPMQKCSLTLHKITWVHVPGKSKTGEVK